MRRFALVFAPSCVLYTLAIVWRSVKDWILFDRYLIPLLPVLVIPVLWHYQQKIRKTPPASGWALIAVFALYGIATTHDYMAAGRARLQAASAMTTAGIPRTCISAGLEYDGWTELEHSGHVIDADFPGEPEDAQPQPGRRYPVSPPYWYWAKTPSIDPVYMVAYSRLPGLIDAPFPPIRYTAWLPPFHRWVFVQKAPSGGCTPARSF